MVRFARAKAKRSATGRDMVPFAGTTTGTTGISIPAERISLYGVDPDIAVFKKAIADGFTMAAIVGRASVMDEGDRKTILIGQIGIAPTRGERLVDL